MSGTYQIDGSLFPINPIKTVWKRDHLGTRGNGTPIYAPYWKCEMEWSYMTMEEKAYFYDKWTAGGMHTVILPHPRDDALTQFADATISLFEADRFDVAGFAERPKLVIDKLYIGGIS